MKYNFDEIINRVGTESVKYDLRGKIFGNPDVIPMWVADMDFRTPDFIRNAVIERAKYDVYGYTFREDKYFEAIANWIRRRHQWDVKKEWMTYTPGVVCAFNMAVMGLTNEGDEVIIFGEQMPLQSLASSSGLIEYELLTSISPRVKRVYLEE